MAKTIKIGQIALSFHRASAQYVANVLIERGYKVGIQEATHETAFNMLQNGEIDILVSAWLPHSHGKYLDPFIDDVIQSGIIYNPYCIWGLPDYVESSFISNVEDLKKADVLQVIDKQIFCINPGAGISRFSQEILEKYQLNKLGYTITNLPEDDYFAYIEKSISQKKVFVIPFWQPQFLHYKHHLRELSEPYGLLRSEDKATLLIRKDAVSKLDAETLEILKNNHIGNKRISALDYLLHVEKREIADALKYINQIK